MRPQKYYDVGCIKCGRHRSTDFEMGMELNRKTILRLARKEGWQEDPETGMPICPRCVATLKKGEYR